MAHNFGTVLKCSWKEDTGCMTVLVVLVGSFPGLSWELLL